MTLPEQLIKLAEAHPEVIVLWLYGSQAKGNAGPASDWQQALGLPERKLSVVDINQAPIPLAFSVVDACHPLYSRDEGRRLQEEGRVMSQMEINYRNTHG